MKANLYTLFYAALLGTVCALLLTGAAEFTEPFKTKNAEADKNRNILIALGVEFDQESATASDLVEVFKKNVTEKQSDDRVLYVYSLGDEVKAIAAPFEGTGVWGPIKGFLALKEDMRTIVGITFYEQEETPGLGGEIVTDSFTGRFKQNKKIVDPQGNPGLIIAVGAGDKQNGIDGISGATMTCDKVEDMLNKTITSLVGESASE